MMSPFMAMSKEVIREQERYKRVYLMPTAKVMELSKYAMDERS